MHLWGRPSRVHGALGATCREGTVLATSEGEGGGVSVRPRRRSARAGAPRPPRPLRAPRRAAELMTPRTAKFLLPQGRGGPWILRLPISTLPQALPPTRPCPEEDAPGQHPTRVGEQGKGPKGQDAAHLCCRLSLLRGSPDLKVGVALCGGRPGLLKPLGAHQRRPSAADVRQRSLSRSALRPCLIRAGHRLYAYKLADKLGARRVSTFTL